MAGRSYKQCSTKILERGTLIDVAANGVAQDTYSEESQWNIIRDILKQQVEMLKQYRSMH